MNILELTHITAGYGDKKVLDDVSLSITQGDIVLLIGSNGSGKSTLFKVISGLIAPWGNGYVTYKNAILQSSLYRTHPNQLISKGIVYIPQVGGTFNDMSIEDNIRFSMLHLSSLKLIHSKINEVFELFPVLKEKRSMRVDKLSGGERKLLCIAIAISNHPDLLLLDEPLAGVSENNLVNIISFIRQLNQHGTTIVIVEHRFDEIYNFAKDIFFIKNGYVFCDTKDSIDSIKYRLL